MKTMKRKKKQVIDDFICGFSCAIVGLSSLHGQPGMARDIAMCNGYDLRDFIKGGASDYDLRELKKIFKKVRP